MSAFLRISPPGAIVEDCR